MIDPPIITTEEPKKKKKLFSLLIFFVLPAAVLGLFFAGKLLLPVFLKPKAEVAPPEPSPNCQLEVNIAAEATPTPAPVKKGLCEQCLGTYDCQEGLGCWPCGSATLSKCAVSSCNECITPTP